MYYSFKKYQSNKISLIIKQKLYYLNIEYIYYIKIYQYLIIFIINSRFVINNNCFL